MVLWNPAHGAPYTDYGIMIPFSASRPRKILDELGAAAGRLGVWELSGEDTIGRADIARVHSPAYVERLYGPGLEGALLECYELIGEDGRPHRYEPEKAVRPLSGIFDQARAGAAGTWACCRLALGLPAAVRPAGEAVREPPRFCYFLGGGNHHARWNGGAGFCLINEIVIACRKLQAEDGVGLIWIIDVDCHKGCGTAELAARERAAGQGGIVTLSAHMAHGWPLDDETLAGVKPGEAPLVPSDIELPVEAGEEGRYCAILAGGLERLAGLPAAARPDFALVVDGADVYEHDGLPSSGLLNLTLEQCLERDMLIYDFLAGRNIPQAWIMAGGYGERAWEPPENFLRYLADKRV